MAGIDFRYSGQLASGDDETHLAPILATVRAGPMDAACLIDNAVTLATNPTNGPHQAATLYKTWIACNATHPGLHAIYFNYAVCLADSDDLAGAANALRAAIALKPDFGPPHINLGTTLERLGQPGPAVQAWLTFVESQSAVTPDALRYKVLALKQAGRVLEQSNQDSAAEDALRQSLELDPAQGDAMQHFIALRQRQCKWPAIPDTGPIPVIALRETISPLSVAYLADDPIFHLATAHNYARRTVGLPPTPPPPAPPPTIADRTRRLRIGYVSSDLRDHAVGFAMTEIIELHDRNQVEIFAYYCGIPASDNTQRRIMAAADHWTDLNGLDDAAAANAIRAHGIDILVDLNGYTKDARTKVFAHRPAPVAVNWFGFPGSMGTPYHHYLIADLHVVPPEAELYYSEKILRLPCYQPNDRKRVVATTTPDRAAAGLPPEGFVFCCLNGMQKLNAQVFGLWMSILHQTPNSVLWLLAGTNDTNDRLRAAATAAGIDPARLLFADKQPNPLHLARMPLADLFLDTFPYGAHTTASDAMWMGLPVLTMQGRSFASRVCASLVAAAGVPELVCDTPSHYVQRAVELATTGTELTTLRTRLQTARDRSTLFDTTGLVQALERLFREMHESRLKGELPRPDLKNLELYHEIAAATPLENNGPATDEAIRRHYQTHLAEVDASYPVERDRRLWRDIAEEACEIPL